MQQAGAGFDLVDAGYYALEALRLEKGYRAWGRELTPDINPLEAGLGFAVAIDKPGGFLGRNAVLAAKAERPLRRRIVQFTLDDPEPVLWGGELVLRDGIPVGEMRSAAYGHTLGRSVGLALIGSASGIDDQFLQGRFEVDVAGRTSAATLHRRPAYDPSGSRMKADAIG